jgi:hypothetical protein
VPLLVVLLEAFAVFVTIAPDGVSACQLPPMPCPFASPAFASRAKRYSGRPAYVTWTFPSGRLTVPSSDAVTPGPGTGFAPAATSNGGHSVAHEPRQLTTFFRSDEY